MVLFEDHFWGEKNAGFDVLYHNMKYGNNASCKLVEFVRERSAVEEVYAKSLLKLGKSATSVAQLGTFEPLWGVLRVATEKLASAHMQVVGRFQDLIKELKEYGDKQKERHKQAKEEFGSTADIVQTIQTMTAYLVKSKETYYARCQELDKSKKDGSSPKEIEKAESKMKKAAEEYKLLVEKREIIRNDFHDKMVDASKKFQKIDEEHLKVIVRYLEQYIESQRTGQVAIEQVYKEFLGQVKALTVHHLLDQFVRSKGTGKAIPDVVTFEEYTGQAEGALTNNHSPSLNSVKHPSGFPITLKRIEKKKKKKKAKKDKAQNGPVDSPSSEGGDASSSFEVDEEGYRIRPPDSESTKSGGNSSSSDSDSDDDEPRKLQVVINPVEADKVPQTASVDEIKKITGTLSLSSPSTMRKHLSSSSGEAMRNRSKSASHTSTIKLSRSSDDLLDIDFSQTSFASSADSLTSGSQRNSLQLSQNGASNIADAELTAQSSGDLRSSAPALPSSSSLESTSENTEAEYCDIPPLLPAKKGSTLREEPSESPPPLPAKKGAMASTSFVNDFPSAGVPETTSNDTGIVFSTTAVASDSSNSLLFLKPPPGSEIPRSASVSSALPRPRPQPRTSGSSLLVPGQTTKTASTSSSSATSYSAELLSCLADFTPTTVNTETSDSSNNSPSNENSTVTRPAVVSYMGSTAVTTPPQTLARATTTSALGGSQENVAALVRSKTIGGLPTMSSVVFAKGAAGTVLGRKDDSLPIAVAFIESVNAFFRGSDQSKCMVKVTGDITVSFPASVLPLIYDVENAPMLSFLVRGTSCLEQILPNKSLINSKGQLSGGDGVSYDFNMASLADHLKKQSEQGASTYYNIDIIKYEVKTNGFSTTPLQLCSYWKCDEEATDLRVDYRYNPSCMSAPCSISNLSVLVPMNGGVTIMQSKPSATWSAEHQRALWKLQEVSSTSEPQGTLRARFDLTQGPSTPSRIAVQFTCNGATISKLNFELKSQEYKLSLVKKRVTTGKYIAES
ncbi:F-BAR domain only protein 2-like [Orbicella faveolata]|uniref:F-BAR domain only protein 2-like n=1 Tax=Orbicella faveolata TaxID=48498 RepID=UPI0009E2F1E1|nr:F-BAR domain only protein 2-like [Orbicella faveolata]